MAWMPMVAMGMTAAGGIMSAYSMAGQGDAERLAGEYNARINEWNAEKSKNASIEEEKRFRTAVRKEEASNVANILASGIQLEGSPLEVLRDNARMASEDAMAIRMNGFNQSNQYLMEASYARSTGRSRARGYGMGAAAEVLNTTGRVAQMYGS